MDHRLGLRTFSASGPSSLLFKPVPPCCLVVPPYVCFCSFNNGHRTVSFPFPPPLPRPPQTMVVAQCRIFVPSQTQQSTGVQHRRWALHFERDCRLGRRYVQSENGDERRQKRQSILEGIGTGTHDRKKKFETKKITLPYNGRRVCPLVKHGGRAQTPRKHT